MNIGSILRRYSLMLLAIVAGLPIEVLAQDGNAASVWSLRPLPYRAMPVALDSLARISGATLSHGRTSRGAEVLMEMPGNWNGSLVVYLRGGAAICIPDQPKTCELKVNPPGIRRELIDLHYAWIATSYSDNRIAPKVWALDATDAIDLFRAKYGQPALTTDGRRQAGQFVYLMGLSAGGASVQSAIELFPDRFDGAIAGCSGDFSAGITHFFDYGLAAMGLLAHDDPSIANRLGNFRFPGPDIADAISLMQALQRGLGEPYPDAPNANGRKLRTMLKNLSGGDHPLFEASFNKSAAMRIADFLFIGPVIDVGDRSFIDNRATEYRFDTLAGTPMTGAELAFNKTIPRFSCAPEVCSGHAIAPGQQDALGGLYPLSGNITVPVMTLHAIGDPISWLSDGQEYARRVRSKGKSHQLVQRAIRDINHCGFNNQELVQAVDDLSRWVAGSQQPEGDNLSDPRLVAAPEFGCKFTRGPHPEDHQYLQVCGTGQK